MKIRLTDAAVKRLLAIARDGEGDEPARAADRSDEDWKAICNELSCAKRDGEGRISLSPKTFAWAIEEMSWAFEAYWEAEEAGNDPR